MKTKKIIQITAGFYFFVMSILSCDRMLEPDPPTNQISSQEVFDNVATADAVLSNLYAELQYNSFLSGGARGFGTLLGSYTDELDSYLPTSQSAYLEIYNTQILSTNTLIKTMWSNTYKEIYICNAIIEGTTASASIEEEDRKRLIGEAVLIRSLLHLRLAQVFGAVPYVDSTDYVANQIMGKMSVDQIIKKVIGSLEYAENNLTNDYRNTERIYPNRLTALVVLCQAHMLREDWETARQYAQEIISSPLYQLNTDLNSTFKKDGKHIIWQLKPLKGGDATAEAQLYYLAGAPQNYTLTPELVNTFESTDLRKSAWIKEVVVGNTTYFGNNKYRITASNNTEYSVIFRLEEVYCMMAEILARENKVSASLPYINAVRSRAGLPALSNSLTADQLLAEILTEKRKEFFAEGGLRFFDLKRFGKLSDLQSTKPNWMDFRAIWPLPQSELLLNPNLNPQNQGY